VALDSVAAEVWSRREKLYDAEYRPVPIYHPGAGEDGKRPWGKAWPQAALRDPPPAVADPPRPEALNTGILTTGLRAADFDIDDDRVAGSVKQIAFDVLGETLIRFRSNSPRLLLPYRAAEGAPAHQKLTGQFGAVQMLGRDQQFVADGIHGSGVPLEWYPEPPWIHPRSNLPAIKPEQETEFFARIAKEIGARGVHDKPRVHEEPDASTDTDAMERGGFVPWRASAAVQQFARTGLRDIRRLASDRYRASGGIVPESSHMRDAFAFTAAILIALIEPAGDVLDRTMEFCRHFTEPDFLTDSVPRYISSLLVKAFKAADGVRKFHRGRWTVPLYTPSRAWLVAQLEVTREEQVRLGLGALVGDAEKKQRKARAKGVAERSEYLAPAAARRPIIIAMKGRGMTWRAIADDLGISTTQAYRLGTSTELVPGPGGVLSEKVSKTSRSLSRSSGLSNLPKGV
jgi:hypothetical protein